MMHFKIPAHILLLALFLSFPVCRAHGQAGQELPALELEIQQLFKTLQSTLPDGKKVEINDSISGLMEKALANSASFSYPFDSLSLMGKVLATDGKLRIYSWNLVTSQNTYKYYGFLQYHPREKQVQLWKLLDNAILDKNAVNRVFTPASWYGALVYKILHQRSDGQDFYTLLASDMNSLLSAKKIIDCLWFDREGNPFFGRPVFTDSKGQLQHRIVFEFASQAVMGLTWEPRMEMILFDHLSPIQAGMEGNYKFYGPDLSIDGYHFEKGIWHYVSEVQVKPQ